jgi:tripeptide aminopeptidase
LTQNQIPTQLQPQVLQNSGIANQLVEELKQIGMQDVTIDNKAYIMATLPSNVTHEVPTIVSSLILTLLLILQEPM